MCKPVRWKHFTCILLPGVQIVVKIRCPAFANCRTSLYRFLSPDSFPPIFLASGGEASRTHTSDFLSSLNSLLLHQGNSQVKRGPAGALGSLPRESLRPQVDCHRTVAPHLVFLGLHNSSTQKCLPVPPCFSALTSFFTAAVGISSSYSTEF